MYDGGSFLQQPLYVNAGFFVVRSNERTRRLLYEISVASEGERSQQAIALHAAPAWCCCSLYVARGYVVVPTRLPRGRISSLRLSFSIIS